MAVRAVSRRLAAYSVLMDREPFAVEGSVRPYGVEAGQMAVGGDRGRLPLEGARSIARRRTRVSTATDVIAAPIP
ncbi:hypothetical protein [Streptomyces sp. cmx-18-6]|uniref:hypothetical protein n=1 Tax=Streptomyces sp. cmx-18-6 TaxID=2790930 RepID=UPI0039810C8F